jgi:hypothetical protein
MLSAASAGGIFLCILPQEISEKSLLSPFFFKESVYNINLDNNIHFSRYEWEACP